MTSTTAANYDPALKQIYRPDNYRASTYQKRPLFGMIPKFEGFGGRNMPVVWQYGNPQGISSDFATAQAGATEIKLEDALLTRVNLHAVATIDGDIIEASENDKYAFLAALTNKIDSAMDGLADRIESYLFRAGPGAIGQISASSNVATASITLDPIGEVANFEVGMKVVASATDGGSLRSSGAAATITGVNYTTGVLSVAVAWSTSIAAVAASDFLSAKGDAKNGGSSNLVFTGLAGWLPTSVSGGESFFGVDRSVSSRLYGNYYDGSSYDMEEAIVNGLSTASEQEGSPELIIMHHTKFRRFKIEVGSKEFFNKPATGPKGPMATVSYRGINISGDYGDATVVPANKCQPTTAWALDLSTWEFPTLGPATRINDRDGLKMLRQSSADGYEVRLRSRGNVKCVAPAKNARILLPS